MHLVQLCWIWPRSNSPVLPHSSIIFPLKFSTVSGRQVPSFCPPLKPQMPLNPSYFCSNTQRHHDTLTDHLISSKIRRKLKETLCILNLFCILSLLCILNLPHILNLHCMLNFTVFPFVTYCTVIYSHWEVVVHIRNDWFQVNNSKSSSKRM